MLVEPRLQGFLARIFFDIAREGNADRFAVVKLFNFLDELDPVHHGHAYVDDRYVGRMLHDHFQTLGSIMSLEDGKPLLRKNEAKEIARVFVVVDKKDLRIVLRHADYQWEFNFRRPENWANENVRVGLQRFLT